VRRILQAMKANTSPDAFPIYRAADAFPLRRASAPCPISDIGATLRQFDAAIAELRAGVERMRAGVRWLDSEIATRREIAGGAQ
jgi:hypothetical protein